MSLVGLASAALRCGFVGVVAPILLVGQLGSQLAWQLELQSAANLEYALFESGEGVAAESQAVADQELAIEDGAAAAELQARAGEEAGVAAENAAQAGAAGTDAAKDEGGRDAAGSTAAGDTIAGAEGTAAGSAEGAESIGAQGGAAATVEAETADTAITAQAAEVADAARVGWTSGAASAGAEAGEASLAGGASAAATEAAEAGWVSGAASAGAEAAEVGWTSGIAASAAGAVGASEAAGIGSVAAVGGAAGMEGAAGAVAAATAADAVAAGAAGVAGGAALGAAGAAAAPVVAATVVGAAAVEEAPAIAAAASNEWRSVAADVEAAQAESLAVEKATEGEAFEAAAATFQAGAVSAEVAAAGGVAAAVGNIIFAQILQIGSLALQGPVVAVIGAQKVARWIPSGSCWPTLGAAGAASAGTMALKANVAGHAAEPQFAVFFSGLAVQASLAAALAAAIAPAWARTIIVASDWWSESFGASSKALAGLQSQFERVMPKANTNRTISHHAANTSRRLWDWSESVRDQVQDGLGNAVSRTGDVINDVSRKAGIGEFERQVGKGVGDVASQAGSAVHEAAHKAGSALNHATHQATKAILVRRPNTKTTTVPPMTTRAPPPQTDAWPLFTSALHGFADTVFHWAWPVIADIGIISLSFVAVEMGVAFGRHRSALRCGCTNPVAVIHELLGAVAAQWCMGIGLLVALWLLSIALASELRFAALWVDGVDENILIVLTVVLVVVCGLTVANQSRLLSRNPCRLCGGCPYMPIPHGKSPEAEGKMKKFGDVASKVASGTAVLLVAAASALVGSLEAPLFTWGLTSTYTSFLAVWWLLPVLPWQLLADHVAWFLPGWMKLALQAHASVLALAALVSTALVGFVLYRVSSQCRAGLTEPPSLKDEAFGLHFASRCADSPLTSGEISNTKHPIKCDDTRLTSEELPMQDSSASFDPEIPAI